MDDGNARARAEAQKALAKVPMTFKGNTEAGDMQDAAVATRKPTTS